MVKSRIAFPCTSLMVTLVFVGTIFRTREYFYSEFSEFSEFKDYP